MGIFDKLKGRQVRDPLKSEGYFRKYIQQQEERIDRFADTLKRGEIPQERRYLVEIFVAQLKYSVLTAKYSMGADLNDLSKEWPEVLCAMAKNWDNTIGLVDLIDTVALAVYCMRWMTQHGIPCQRLLVNTDGKIGWLDFCSHQGRAGRTIESGRFA